MSFRRAVAPQGRAAYIMRGPCHIEWRLGQANGVVPGISVHFPRRQLHFDVNSVVVSGPTVGGSVETLFDTQKLIVKSS